MAMSTSYLKQLNLRAMSISYDKQMSSCVFNFNYNLCPYNEVVGMLSAQAAQKGLHLSVDIELGLPPVLRSDTMKLKQVLVNLLSNSIKFTQTGRVTLMVSKAAAEEAAAVRRCTLTRIDNLVGIA
jgi:signal transduction histidine kinase